MPRLALSTNMQTEEEQQDRYDIAILGAEEDHESIDKLRNILLKTIRIPNMILKIITLNMVSTDVSLAEKVKQIIQKSTYQFFFVTENFEKDTLATFTKNEAIGQTLTTSHWSVVPVYRNVEAQKLRIFGFDSVKGFDVNLFLKGVSLDDVDVESLEASDVSENVVKSLTALLQDRKDKDRDN